MERELGVAVGPAGKGAEASSLGDRGGLDLGGGHHPVEVAGLDGPRRDVDHRLHGGPQQVGRGDAGLRQLDGVVGEAHPDGRIVEPDLGWAVAADDTLADWQIRPPLISADTLNNELERPHALFHNGLYYMFWSTQSHVFNPDGPVGPTGLYGMVSEQLSGPWHPLNGTGLVFANPASAPKQAYSWLVMPDLQVTSFIDAWGSSGSDDLARRFGATFAPMLQLRLDKDAAGLVEKA